ncbi:hypothetical protein [Sedimenticola sp.]|uniref:hypothetical protein n=1 Tax=Sedimenticola sp. TaxID=1940285 RepID=UPI003D0D9183
MQRFFHGAFCLTLAVTAVLADEPRRFADTGTNWRPIETTPAERPAQTIDATGISSQPSRSSTIQGYPSNGYPLSAPAIPYDGTYPSGETASSAPYPYSSGADETSVPPVYPYQPEYSATPWGYPAAPGYSSGYDQPSAYGYPYPYPTAPSYPPYAAPLEYGYPQGYGQEYGYPTQPAPGYENGYYYPNTGYAPDDTPYYPAAPLRQQQPPSYVPTQPAPPGWDEQGAYLNPPPSSQYPQEQPDAPVTPLPGESAPQDSRNQGHDYRVNGAPAKFRPWTDPRIEAPAEETAR